MYKENGTCKCSRIVLFRFSFVEKSFSVGLSCCKTSGDSRHHKYFTHFTEQWFAKEF